MYCVEMKFVGRISDKSLVKMLTDCGFNEIPILGELTITTKANVRKFPTEPELAQIASIYRESINAQENVPQYFIDLNFDGYRSITQIEEDKEK